MRAYVKGEWKALTATEFDKYIEELVNKSNQFNDLQIFRSMQEATETLGAGKWFKYAENNLDGVVSPENSIIGITNINNLK